MIALFWMNYGNDGGDVRAEHEDHPAGCRLSTPRFDSREAANEWAARNIAWMHNMPYVIVANTGGNGDG